MKLMRFLSLLIIAVLLNACTTFKEDKETAASRGTFAMTAKYTSQAVPLNGNIDSAQWNKAPSYSFKKFKRFYTTNMKLAQNGYVKFLWDENFLYVGVKLDDYDIVATKNKDQIHHYALGDLIEVFIKSIDGPTFGEFYATPFNNKTSIFFPSRGRQIFPECLKTLLKDFKVSVKLNGSLNNWKDKDKGWSAILAIPLKGLAQNNIKITAENSFRVMVARINYGYSLDNKEYSSVPFNSGKPRGLHSYEDWGILTLQK